MYAVSSSAPPLDITLPLVVQVQGCSLYIIAYTKFIWIDPFKVSNFLTCLKSHVDHCVHYYDLRNTKQPIMVFKGHRKAVSYAKFVNGEEIVSAYVYTSFVYLWDMNVIGVLVLVIGTKLLVLQMEWRSSCENRSCGLPSIKFILNSK